MKFNRPENLTFDYTYTNKIDMYAGYTCWGDEFSGGIYKYKNSLTCNLKPGIEYEQIMKGRKYRGIYGSFSGNGTITFYNKNGKKIKTCSLKKKAQYLEAKGATSFRLSGGTQVNIEFNHTKMLD